MTRGDVALSGLLLCCAVLASCTEQPRGGEAVTAANVPAASLEAKAEQLKGTIVTAHLEQEVPKTKNVLWCATFQLAWNELMKMNGGKVQLVPPHAIARHLNQAAVALEHVPKGGVVAAAGLLGDGIVQQIRRRLDESFKGQARPQLLSAAEAYPPEAVVMYAYLLRELRFAVPFERLTPGTFEDGNQNELASVALFGIDEFSPGDRKQVAQADQVRILWHRFNVDLTRMKDQEGLFSEEFIVELQTDSAADRLILAKVTPGRTLGKIVNSVLKRIESPNSRRTEELMPPELNQLLETVEAPDEDKNRERFQKALEGLSRYSCLLLDESLQVPVLDFDVTKEYSELLGRTVVSANPKLNGKPFVEAQQRIRFGLNERGVVLESEAFGGLFGGDAVRDFSFTEPFLILLMRKGASQPYLALWVGNAELLVHQKPAQETDD